MLSADREFIQHGWTQSPLSEPQNCRFPHGGVRMCLNELLVCKEEAFLILSIKETKERGLMKKDSCYEA